MNEPLIMDDQTFVGQFEAQTLDPKCFNHKGHLRLCWSYLSNDPVDTAVEKVTSGIAAYAQSLGATDKFHFTLTEAIVRIVAARRAGSSQVEFEEFLAANSDLVDGMIEVVGQYYSTALLQSGAAKKHFVPPDIAPLPDTDRC